MSTGLTIKIGKAKDQYWGLFVAPIAIYSKDGSLLYRRKKYNANPFFKSGDDSDPVYYILSLNEEHVYFRERKWGAINDLWDVIFDTRTAKIKRLPFGSLNEQERIKMESEPFELNQVSKWNEVEWETAPRHKGLWYLLDGI